jgi:hypothetical protein
VLHRAREIFTQPRATPAVTEIDVVLAEDVAR